MKTKKTSRAAAKAVPFLRGEKIFLAPFTRKHLHSPEYLAWMNDLEITSNLVLSDYLFPVRFNQLEEYYLKNVSAKNGAFFAVHEKKSGRFIGTCKLSPFDPIVRSAEFGRVIGEKAARGKNYGTEIIRLLADYAFGTLNLNKLTAGTHSENAAALRTYQKMGFKVEARIREACYKDGKYLDVIRVGLLRREWKK